MATHDEFTEDDWTPEESALLAALPKERAPSNELKARTIEAVRLRGGTASHRIASTRRAVILAAAASLIFIAGALVGYAAARHAVQPDDDSRMATRQAVAKTSDAQPTIPPTRHVVWY